MEALCSLFEVVECFGAIVGRSEEKSQELASLIISVEIITASVKVFAQDLLPEERDEAFHSNKVFPELAKQLTLCDEVISKRYMAIENASGQARAVPAPSRVSTGIKQGVRSYGREALEVLKSRFGAMGSLLKLPEDELAVIRSASAELQKLVPLLNLAIISQQSIGRKRLFIASESSVESSFDGRNKRPRLQDASSAADCATSSRPRSLEEDSKFFLQLVSDAAVARSCALPALTISDLRPQSNSTTSLEPASGPVSPRDMEKTIELSSSILEPYPGGSDSSATTAHVQSVSNAGAAANAPAKKLFGRHELRERVPRQFMLPVLNGGAHSEFQHVSRFVSRDLFLLEEKPAPPPAWSVQASQDMPTLEFGGDNAFPDDSGTLPMGMPTASTQATPLTLATAKGLSKLGLHCRSSGETLWRWLAQDAETELHVGDRIALLLESPPGSFTPGPARDLEAHEVTCLLGVEIRLPKHLIMPC